MNRIEHNLVQVAAIVPLSAEFGGDDLLVLRDGNGFVLPVGPLQPGERLLHAAMRIVAERAGFCPVPVRLAYLLERTDGVLVVGVQCELPLDVDDGNDLQGEFISLSQSDAHFEPMALREILVEDLRSGFVRPVAHVIEAAAGESPSVHITW